MPERLFLGAKYVCTTCRTRGVTRTCACSKDAARVFDITQSENTRPLLNLLDPPEPRPIHKRDIYTHLRASRAEWAASAILALAFLLLLPLSLPGSVATVVGLAVFFVTILLGARVVVALAGLVLRFVFALVFLLLATITAIVSVLPRRRRSRRLPRSAPGFRERADLWTRALLGETLRALETGRDETVHLAPLKMRAVDALDGQTNAPIHGSSSWGRRGTVRIADAELEPFAVTLPSGERVRVVPGSGCVLVHDDCLDSAEDDPRPHRYFVDPKQVTLRANLGVRVRGGTWSEAREPTGDHAGFREAPKTRVLVGSEDAPLEVSFRSVAEKELVRQR